MKKNVIIVLVALFVLMLPGCSRSTSGSSGQGTQAASGPVQITQPVTVTLWTSPDWAGIWEANEPGAGYGDFYRYAGTEFNKQNPNVTVHVESVPGAEAVQKFAVALQSNTMPDIYVNTEFTVYDYAHAGLLEPLNSIIEPADYEDIPKALWDMVSTNGDVYVYPFYNESGHLVINVSLFEQYGINPADYIKEYGGPDEIGRWTPDEFRNLLRAVKPKLPSNVYPYGFWCGSAMGDTFNRLMMTMFGGSNFDPVTKKSTSNSPENVQALQFLVDCYREGLFAPGAETLTVLDVYQLVLNKQLAVGIFNNVNYDNLVQGLANGTIPGPFEFKMMFLPRVGDPTCYAYIKGSCVFKQSNAMQTEAAKQFVKFFSSGPMAKGSLAMLPHRLSVAKMMDDPRKIAIVESSKYAGDFWMQVPGYNALRRMFFPTLQAALTGAKTPQQALDDFTRESNELIEDYIADSVFFKK